MSDEMVISQTKLFVGGLNRQMRGYDLRQEFSPFGEIVFAKVNLDRETNRSKGFGFVEFADAEGASKAQKEMDGKEVRGRTIKVDFAKEDPTKVYRRPEGEQAPIATAPSAQPSNDETNDEIPADETVVDENVF
ncbi:hypothetical protein AGMMS50249_5340 [candidate division SR1 bacterium]|nr:hypothetical protein AGMMS50249_5340 [candidate division SR1 bacterium]